MYSYTRSPKPKTERERERDQFSAILGPRAIESISGQIWRKVGSIKREMAVNLQFASRPSMGLEAMRLIHFAPVQHFPLIGLHAEAEEGKLQPRRRHRQALRNRAARGDQW